MITPQEEALALVNPFDFDLKNNTNGVLELAEDADPTAKVDLDDSRAAQEPQDTTQTIHGGATSAAGFWPDGATGLDAAAGAVAAPDTADQTSVAATAQHASEQLPHRLPAST